MKDSVSENANVQVDGMPLRLLPLRLRLKSETLALDFFSGPLWRSGFGLALKSHFPAVFDLLFAEHARLGRLYALQSPLAAVNPGDHFELGLTLFGAATEHAVACTQAVGRLGEMGLGERRGRYHLLDARVAGSGSPPFWMQRRAWRPGLPLQALSCG